MKAWLAKWGKVAWGVLAGILAAVAAFLAWSLSATGRRDNTVPDHTAADLAAAKEKADAAKRELVAGQNRVASDLSHLDGDALVARLLRDVGEPSDKPSP